MPPRQRDVSEFRFSAPVVESRSLRGRRRVDTVDDDDLVIALIAVPLGFLAEVDDRTRGFVEGPILFTRRAVVFHFARHTH